MKRSNAVTWVGGTLFVLAVGAMAWMLLGAADAPDGGVYLSALGQPLVGTEVGESGWAKVYVAVNTGSSYVQGLTQENFRVNTIAGGEVRLERVQALFPGVYSLEVSQVGDIWRWHELILAITMRGQHGSSTCLVSIDIP